MTETLAHGYSSDSTQRELSNEYQHDRVKMVFKNLCVPLLWTKVALACIERVKDHFTNTYRSPSFRSGTCIPVGDMLVPGIKALPAELVLAT